MKKRDDEIEIKSTLGHMKLAAFAIHSLKEDAEISLAYLNAQIFKHDGEEASRYKEELDDLAGVNQVAVPTPPGNNSDMTPVSMPVQSFMEKCQAEAVAVEDADDQVDSFFDDIAVAIVMNEGSCLSDETRAAIKNAVDNHNVELIFHSAEKN